MVFLIWNSLIFASYIFAQHPVINTTLVVISDKTPYNRLASFPQQVMFFDGDDDDGDCGTDKPEEGGYNMGDEIGERIGEGHDPIEDEIS